MYLKKKNKHLPYDKLRGILSEHRITYKDVAIALNITEAAVGHKINGSSDFYLTEVKKLKEIYGIEYSIFFASWVS